MSYEIPQRISSVLTAARVGFYKSDVHYAYLRISWIDKEEGQLCIEVCPPNKIYELTRRRKGRGSIEHIIWWENKEAMEILSNFLPSPYGGFPDYEVHHIDKNGKLIK